MRDSRLLAPILPDLGITPGLEEVKLFCKKLRVFLTQLEQFILAGDETRLSLLVYAATLEYNHTLGEIIKFTTVHATGNTTINASFPKAGLLTIIATNDATSGKVITFGTGFKSTGTLTGTVNKTAVVQFVCDGTSYWEISRTLNLV